MAMYIRYWMKKLVSRMTFFIIIGFGLVAIGPGSVCCRAADKVPVTILITLEAKDKPLSQVLQKITQTTGYTFLLDETWKHLPVTVALKKTALHEGLRLILKDFSTAIIVDDVQKKTITLILGNLKQDQTGSKTAISQNYSEKSQNQATEAPTRAQKDTVSLDVQVIPPIKPGERGVTLGEIEAARTSQPDTGPDVHPVEVLPLSPGSNKGITLQEIKRIRARQMPTAAAPAEPVPNIEKLKANQQHTNQD
jgi:hypothetical protein